MVFFNILPRQREQLLFFKNLVYGVSATEKKTSLIWAIIAGLQNTELFYKQNNKLLGWAKELCDKLDKNLDRKKSNTETNINLEITTLLEILYQEYAINLIIELYPSTTNQIKYQYIHTESPYSAVIRIVNIINKQVKCFCAFFTNNIDLNILNGKIPLRWADYESESGSESDQPQSTFRIPIAITPLLDICRQHPKDEEKSKYVEIKKRPDFYRNKLVADIIINIPDIAETFNVARKIISSGGINSMKKIHEQTNAKLRLRGIGSGFKEFEYGNQEADMPLTLCVSLDNNSHSISALSLYFHTLYLIDKLLHKIYNNYLRVCKIHCITPNETKPKLIEKGKYNLLKNMKRPEFCILETLATPNYELYTDTHKRRKKVRGIRGGNRQ